MTLKDVQWQPVYESGFRSGDTLVESFYQPFSSGVEKYGRLRAISDGISQMSLGECYYWHAKARSPTSPNGVKALRTLLAEHIE